MNRIALALVLALVPACSSSTPSPDDPASISAALVGSWQGSCFDAGNGNHAQLTFAIDEARWAVDYTLHGDAACTAPMGNVHIAGPYEIAGASAKVTGASEGIFEFDTRTIEPKVQGFADFLNSLDGCGDGGFQVGVAQDVYAKGCPALGNYPQSMCTADYDVVRVDATSLQFGKRPADNNMCSADKRPAELNPDVLHKM